MKIQVNEQALTLPSSMNLEQLLIHLEKPLIGSAVAVNMQVVSRSEWSQYNINEGDSISLFQAIAGG